MKQVKFYIDEKQYEYLKKLAEEQGLSIPSFVKNIILKAIGELEPGVEENVKDLMRKEEQLRKEVGRIEMDLINIMKKVEKIERELYKRTQKITSENLAF